MQVDQVLGGLWLLVGSFTMMTWTYRKKWRLTWVTCVLPPASAGLCYLLQLAFLGAPPPLLFLLVAAAVGAAAGVFRGRTHEVRIQDGAPWVERTSWYLLAWAVCYGFAQVFALLDQRELMDVGRVGGAFSTAMLMTVSLVVFQRAEAARSGGTVPR